MILERAQLRNFGIYRGEHTIDLSPRNSSGKKKPIILIGGLNGGGKTTFLDAVLLALYGPRARCSKRGTWGYDDFLRQSIHKGTPAAEGASVAVAFQYAADEEQHTYEVRRSWWATDGRAKERLEVFCDGVLDRNRTENWPQLVEELLPTGLSQLFFFDGDRIRSLAEDGNYAEVLGGAIKSLLGLDVVERLIADCDILERRYKKTQLSKQDQKLYDEQQTALEELEKKLKEKRAEIASERNTLLRCESTLKSCEEEFALHGGKFHERRETLKAREAELRTTRDALFVELEGLVAGLLPLTLLGGLLEGVSKAHQSHTVGRSAAEVQRLLEVRDKAVLTAFSRTEAGKPAVRSLDEILKEDRAKRAKPRKTATESDLSDRSGARLDLFLEEELDPLKKQVGNLLEQIDTLTTELEAIERNLAMAPDDAKLLSTTEKLKAENRKHAASKEKVAALEARISELTRESDIKRGQLVRMVEGRHGEQADQEDAVRKIELARRTSVAMQHFLRVSTSRKIERLAALITESFQFLLRKKSFVERVVIDPDSFSIELVSLDGRSLSRDRLSEGEKQLFAVSVLWGLAKASGRPLPAIIDTPMARLDSEHRTNLVERYFPNASHQVIVLSTDTEIDREYFQRLKPHTARAYCLDYLEKKQETVVREGYFWD